MRNIILSISLLAALSLIGCGPDPKPVGFDDSLSTEVQQKDWSNPSGGAGVVLETKNYRIFTTITQHEMQSILPGFMESAHRAYLRLLNLPDHPTADKLPMYILATREQWAALTRSITGPQADLYMRIEQGGYCFQNVCVLWQIGGLATLSVASHEGMHQFLHHRLKDQLPMWLEEGLCVVMESQDVQGQVVTFDPKHNVGRFGDLCNALTKNFWIPVDRLLPMDAGDALGPYAERATSYYGQLWALVQFLRSDPQYSAGLDRLLRDAEAGNFHKALGVPPEALAELRLRGRIYNQTISEKIFRHYLSDDMKTFEKRYKAYSMQLAQLQ